MLKEVFTIRITIDQHESGVLYETPLILDIIHREKYPSNEEIEELITKMGGNGAKVEKQYKLI